MRVKLKVRVVEYTLQTLQKMKKNVGYGLEEKPEKKEGSVPDKKCPYYGDVAVRGKLFEGTVVSDSMARTVKVEWQTFVKDAKYSRYLKKRTRVAAHNPDSIGAKKGDFVLIGETRPLSKTKHFTVLKIIKEAETQ